MPIAGRRATPGWGIALCAMLQPWGSSGVSVGNLAHGGPLSGRPPDLSQQPQQQPSARLLPLYLDSSRAAPAATLSRFLSHADAC